LSFHISATIPFIYIQNIATQVTSPLLPPWLCPAYAYPHLAINFCLNKVQLIIFLIYLILH